MDESYSYAGFVIGSQVALPGVPTTPNFLGGAPDVIIRFGDGFSGEGFIYLTPLISIRADEVVRLHVPSVATFFISKRLIEIAINAEGKESDLRTLILGPAISILLCLRGLLPVRASGIGFGGRVVAFVGATGVGKSFLCAMLSKSRFRTLFDGTGVFDVVQGVAVSRVHTFHESQWEDTFHALNIPLCDVENTREGQRRYRRVLVERQSSGVPHDLCGVFILERANAMRIEPKKIGEEDARELLFMNLKHQKLARHLGLTSAFEQLASAIASRVPCIRWPRAMSENSGAELTLLESFLPI